MTPEHAVRTAAHHADIPMAEMTVLYEQIAIWRRYGIALTTDGTSLRLRAPAGLTDDRRESIRAFAAKHKPALILLLSNLDDDHDDRWLLDAFLGNDATPQAVLSTLIGLASENFITPPFGGFDWDRGRRAWRDGWQDNDQVLDWVDAAVVVSDLVCDALGLHTGMMRTEWVELALRCGALIEEARQPYPVNLDDWLHAVERPVTEAVRASLVEHHDEVDRALYRTARRRESRDSRTRTQSPQPRCVACGSSWFESFTGGTLRSCDCGRQW